MLVSLKACKFEHNELAIHFESFNDECTIVKEAQDANLLSQESKRKKAFVARNLALISVTMQSSNQPTQLQRLASIMKYCKKQAKVLHVR